MKTKHMAMTARVTRRTMTARTGEWALDEAGERRATTTADSASTFDDQIGECAKSVCFNSGQATVNRTGIAFCNGTGEKKKGKARVTTIKETE